MSKPKPRRAKVKLTRTVTEIAVVLLDSEGNVEEIEDVLDELDYEVIELHSIQNVLSVQW